LHQSPSPKYTSEFVNSYRCLFCCRIEEEVKREEPVVKKDQQKMIDAGKEAAIEAEVKAARERAIVPLEIRMKQFRDMLAEKEVCLKWGKVLFSDHSNAFAILYPFLRQQEFRVLEQLTWCVCRVTKRMQIF
jgi:hypothetical protein